MSKENIFSEVEKLDDDIGGINWLRNQLEVVENYLYGHYDMNRIDIMQSEIEYLRDENVNGEVYRVCEEMLKVIDSL